MVKISAAAMRRTDVIAHERDHNLAGSAQIQLGKMERNRNGLKPFVSQRVNRFKRCPLKSLVS